MLPCQPAYMPTRTPTLVGPPPTGDVLTSALPRPLTAPADFAYDTMQRPADCVDDRNVYTDSIEPWLTELPPPPHVSRQPTVPLLSDRTQTTASDYVYTDSIPLLSAHRYTYNYQNISANLSLPLLSTHTNVPTHVNAPLSQAIALGQSNVTQPSALYAASYTSDLNSSGIVAFPPPVCTSYADNSQRLPIAVEQPGFSAFSRVDVHHSRPAVADSTVQCAVCTLLPSATADYHQLLLITYGRLSLHIPHHCSLHLYIGENGLHMTISSQTQG